MVGFFYFFWMERGAYFGDEYGVGGGMGYFVLFLGRWEEN